jgi:hypothetical protein
MVGTMATLLSQNNPIEAELFFLTYRISQRFGGVLLFSSKLSTLIQHVWQEWELSRLSQPEAAVRSCVHRRNGFLVSVNL